LRIEIDVKTESKNQSLEKIDENHYLVRVTSPRRKGKANREIIKLLQKHFKCPVKIISGHRSKKKIIELIK
jgi:uncharacterized protein (TIGR00251 family)